MAEPFPENEVQVLPVYITPTLAATLPEIIGALFNAIFPGMINEDRPLNRPAIAANESSIALRAFLQNPTFQQVFVETDTQRPLLDELYFTIRSRKRFGAALGMLEGISTVNGPAFTLSNALNRESIHCTVFESELRPNVGATLQGYRGPDLGAARSFLSATSPESRFRRGLLRAEIHFGKRYRSTTTYGAS